MRTAPRLTSRPSNLYRCQARGLRCWWRRLTQNAWQWLNPRRFPKRRSIICYDYPDLASTLTANLRRVIGQIHAGPLDRRLLALVELRVSQINGFAVCERHGVAVIEDAIYVGLGAALGRPPLYRDRPTQVPVLTCGSVSKVLAPGWRIGWVIGGALSPRILHAKVVGSLGSPTLHQRALAGFLAANGERAVLRRAAQAYRERLHAGRALVIRHFPPGTRCSEPEGGMVLWVELPEGVPIDLLYRQATAEGLCFAPGSLFGVHALHQRHLRMCVSQLHHQAREAIARIGRLASTLAACGGR